MNVRDRFSQESLDIIRKILDEHDNNSIILKADFDADELIQNPVFVSENKKSIMSKLTSFFNKNEVLIRTAKPNLLYPSDLEIEVSDELYNKKKVAFCILSNDLKDFYFLQDIDRKNLQEVEIGNFFKKDGILSEYFDGFEYRKEQEVMARSIQKAINENKKIIVEAGTGTGKTLAYLIPTIKWAVENKKKVIIATNTINLQEQILYKDIPVLKSIIEEKFNYALIKGRNNYLCKKLLDELAVRGVSAEDYTAEQIEQIQAIIKWGNKTETGDKAELPFEVNPEIWEMVQSTPELCGGKKSHYSECFYTKARREKLEADVLISNHHIFFADLNIRANTDFDAEYLILPKYDLVIFDEAHNIESVARNYFSVEVSKYSFKRLLNKIYEKKINKNPKSALRRIEENFSIKKLKNKSKEGEYEELLAFLKDGVQILQNNADEYFEEIRRNFDRGQTSGIKKILTAYEFNESRFLEEIKIKQDKFKGSMKEFLDYLFKMVEIIDVDRENPEVSNFLNYVKLFKTFMDNFKFVTNFLDEEYVYWLDINAKRTNIVLTATPLNISKKLNTTLFENLNRLVFASATLAINDNFDYFKNSVGLENEDCIEKVVKSPFNYDEQMSVYIPSDMEASSNTLDFSIEAGEFIFNILMKTDGKAFILFTSYTMLNQVYYAIKNKLKKYDFDIFLHGEKPRTQIINEFKIAKKPVLFGTTSFWEGVDVQGDNLSNIIIVKLPFLVPIDPIVAAISKKIEEDGRNPFTDFQLPEAVIKFKQGIGRLVRTKNDKGNIFILDNRLIKKYYGKFFVKSIPIKTKNIKILRKDDIINTI